MAKDAGDRFQSADEVVGAIKLLAPDTSRTVLPADDPCGSRRQGLRVSRRALIAAAAVVVVAVAGFTIWRRPAALPPVPPEADVWYQRGLQAMRDGTYETGRRRLEQAIALFPQHVLAYTRLAEAYAELDDDGSAQSNCCAYRTWCLTSRACPRSNACACRRFGRRCCAAWIRRSNCTASWSTARPTPASGSTWAAPRKLQAFAGTRATRMRRSAELDPQSAAAHLRLGSAEALAADCRKRWRPCGSRTALPRGSNVEGETEVLLRREAR